MKKGAVNGRQFEIFLTMALSQNMGEAASKLGVSVAAVSKSLKAFERDIGLDLFRQANGRLVATTEAERLLPFAQRAIDHLNRARLAAHALSGGDIGRIVVGTAGPAFISILPRAIARFQARWPEVRIEIEADNTHNLIEKVAANEVDLGVGTPVVADTDARIWQQCTIRDICETALVVVLPAGHLLAQRSFLRAMDLASESLIGLAETSATTQLIGAAFQQAGVPYSPTIVAGNAIGACSLVQQNVGIGLMNSLMLSPGIFGGLIAKPFRPRISLRTCLYYSKLYKPAPAVQRFIDCIEQVAKKAGGARPDS